MPTRLTIPVALFVVALSTVVAVADEPPRANVVDVPASIPADESRDVTDDLNAFLSRVPADARVVFPANARYRIDGTVLIADKHHLTIDGNGAVFRAIDRGADHAKSENYAGWRATRTRAHLRIKDGADIVVRNVEVHGAHPDAGRAGTYDANREAQHGFDLSGVEDCVIERVNVHDVYGDCVYLAKVRGVAIRQSTLKRCGRQGVAVATGRDVLIEDNTIDDSRRGIIDIEPYGKEWATTNISIINNRLGGSRLLLLPMGGGGVIGTIFLADNINTAPNGVPSIYNVGKADQHRGPFVAVNNRITVGGSTAAGLRVTGNDGVLFAGNMLSYPANRKMTALDLTGSTGVIVGNAFEGADHVLADGATVTALANTTAPDAKPATAPTEWKRIEGGYAVRVTLPDSQVIAVLRGGLSPTPKPQPITGYGLTTAGDFAWARVAKGKIVDGAVRGGDSYKLE
ncbi:MAG: hypothetical protein GC159_20790 [Phycisphaera sp.]|nr:hypothetical protein [Phycisphaera sp.]